MISLRRNSVVAGATAVEAEETWADSALWGASLALLLVVLLLFGVGYVGYASLERPHSAAGSPPPVHVTAPVRTR